MIKIDYDSVNFELTEEVVAEFKDKAGAYWFLEVDPFLKEVRRTFNGVVKHVEVQRGFGSDVVLIRLFEKTGEIQENYWRFTFDYRGNRFYQVL